MNSFGTAEDINSEQDSNTAFPNFETSFEFTAFNSTRTAEDRDEVQDSQTALQHPRITFESPVFNSIRTTENMNAAHDFKTALQHSKIIFESAAFNSFNTAVDICAVQYINAALQDSLTAFGSADIYAAQHSKTACQTSKTAFRPTAFHSLSKISKINTAQHSGTASTAFKITEKHAVDYGTAFQYSKTTFEPKAFHRVSMNTAQNTNTAFNSLGTAEEAVREDEYNNTAFETAARARERAQHHLTALEPAAHSFRAERERESAQHHLTALEPGADSNTAAREKKTPQHHLTALEPAADSNTATRERERAQHHLTELDPATHSFTAGRKLAQQHLSASLKTRTQHLYHLMLYLLLFCAVAVTAKDFGIECLCSTSECLDRGEPTCSSPEAYCYYQVFFSSDGFPTVTQGCLTKGWSLLCENQAPSVGHNGTWPHLLCCSTHRCNTVPPSPAIPPPVPLPPPVPSTVPPTSTTEKQSPLHRLGVSSIEELHQKYGGSDDDGDDSDNQEPSIHLNTLHLAIISAAVFFMLGITALGFCVLAKYRVDYNGRILTQEEENHKTPRSLPMEPLLSV